jgi:hypothetical protein
MKKKRNQFSKKLIKKEIVGNSFRSSNKSCFKQQIQLQKETSEYLLKEKQEIITFVLLYK